MSRYPHPDDALVLAEQLPARQKEMVLRFAEAWAAERIVIESLSNADPVVSDHDGWETCGLCKAVGITDGAAPEHQPWCTWVIGQTWKHLAEADTWP